MKSAVRLVLVGATVTTSSAVGQSGIGGIFLPTLVQISLVFQVSLQQYDTGTVFSILGRKDGMENMNQMTSEK